MALSQLNLIVICVNLLGIALTIYIRCTHKYLKCPVPGCKSARCGGQLVIPNSKAIAGNYFPCPGCQNAVALARSSSGDICLVSLQEAQRLMPGVVFQPITLARGQPTVAISPVQQHQQMQMVVVPPAMGGMGMVIGGSPVPTVQTPVTLPHGWEERRMPDGRVYYADNINQTTSWTPPAVTNIMPASPVVVLK
jgi:hypothetical protein